MQFITKWKLQAVPGKQELHGMPASAVPLSLQTQYDEPVLYVVGGAIAGVETMKIEAVMTGRSAPSNGLYLGTAMMREDSWVLHYFLLGD